MNQADTCPEESGVVDAARLDSALPVDLAAHAAACPACSEALIAVSFLLDASAPEASAVPPAGLVYWKAELRTRRERTEQALRPLRWTEAGSVGVLAIFSVGVGVATDWTIAAASIGFCVALGGCWWAVSALGRAKH